MIWSKIRKWYRRRKISRRPDPKNLTPKELKALRLESIKLASNVAEELLNRWPEDAKIIEKSFSDLTKNRKKMT